MIENGLGNGRGPRLWYQKASVEAKALFFIEHPLDMCINMSYSVPYEHHDWSFGKGMQYLDGALGLHVDDSCGGGARLIMLTKQKLTDVQAGDDCVIHRFIALTEVL